MKKFLSMTLAILMIATLGVVAIAADTFYPDQVIGGLATQDGSFVAFFANDGVVDLGSAKLSSGSYDNTVYFGENMYLALVDDDAAADDFIDEMEAGTYGADYPLINIFASVKSLKVSYYSLNEDANSFMDIANAKVVRKKVIYSTEVPGTVKGISDDADDNTERCLIDNAVSNYAYFIEIPVRDYKKLDTDDKIFTGAIKLRVTKGDYEMEMDKTDFVFIPSQHSIEDAAYDENVIYEDAKYYPSEIFDSNDTEYTFTFDFEDPANSAFVVDMSKQRRDIKLGVTDDVKESEYRVIMDEDNTIDFKFFNFEQVGIFSKLGTLYLYWNDELNNGYIYQVTEDGCVLPLNEYEAVYQDEKSDYPGCYAIKTNKLGRYLITDKSLKLTSLNPKTALTFTDAGVPAAEKVVVTVEKPVEKIVEVEKVVEVPVKESNTASMIAVAVIALVVGAAAIYMLFAKEILVVSKKEEVKAPAKKTATKKTETK